MRRSVLAFGVCAALYPVWSSAGILGGLNSLIDLFQPEDILQVGKALNTGQIQQMQAQQQDLNQKLQEQTMVDKEKVAAKTAWNYRYQTDSLFQLPGECEQSKAASGFLQGQQSLVAQGADNGAVLGNDGTIGVATGKTQEPSSHAVLGDLAQLSNQQTDAQSLFESKDNGEALVVQSTLLNPLPSQPITSVQAKTPAGMQWAAKHNAAEAGLSLAASAMGLVSGMHAISVPGSAVSAIASVAAPSSAKPSSNAGSTGSGSSTQSTSTKIVKAATNPPKTPQKSPSGDGNWRGLVPKYANLVAQVAKEENISPAIIAATIAHEDGSESLTAMPCGNPVMRNKYGYDSLFCVQADSTAKSLGQMIDPTAVSLGSPYGVTDPMQLYGKHPKIELKAMASGLKQFLAQCKGNVACAFGAWNYGHVAPGMAQGVWPNAATQQYAQVSMGFYTGQKVVPVNGYQGGGSSSSLGSGNASPASTAGLLRLVSLGSYANPAFYERLATTSTTGALRTALFLKSISVQVSNENRQLLERLTALMAARVSLAEQQQEIASQNGRRANAMAQSNGAFH